MPVYVFDLSRQVVREDTAQIAIRADTHEAAFAKLHDMTQNELEDATDQDSETWTWDSCARQPHIGEIRIEGFTCELADNSEELDYYPAVIQA